MSTDHHSPRLRALAGLGIVSVLALGACSTGSANSTAAGGASGASGLSAPGVAQKGSAVAPGGAVVGGDAAAKAPDKAAAHGAVPALQNQKLIRTAALQLGVNDVRTAAASVRSIAVTAGGAVSSEDISATTGPGDAPSLTGGAAPESRTGPAATATGETRFERGTLAVAVPTDKLDTVLDQLSGLGTVTQRTSGSQDVTSTYVDTKSRIATMTSSIDRLRALMVRATAIEQVVTLETELSRREADLEALQAQVASLDTQVALSTVTVTLTPTGTAAAPAGDSGFLSGLANGWTAFVKILVGTVTVLGALLPFLLALAVLGLPVFVWWRRRRSAGPAGPASPRASEPAATRAGVAEAPGSPSEGEVEPERAEAAALAGAAGTTERGD